MAGKRKAIKELNHDNWEQEEQPEEAGQFEKAGLEALQGRVIRKAKRMSDASTTSSPFGSFKGFATNSPTTTTPPNKPIFDTFSFGLKNGGAKKELPKTDMNSMSTTSPLSSSLLSEKSSAAVTASTSSSNPEFLSPLKALNESLMDCLKKYMDVSPYYDFTPVFKDYESHLKEIKQKSAVPKVPTFSFGSTTKSPSNVQNDSALKMDGKNTSGNQQFRFSFANAPTPSQPPTNNNEDKEDENYVPPKNEFKPVEETDAVFSKKCKVYYKKENNYVEKGVGMLYLKPLNGKYQLLIRADTSLGNILLNIVVNSALPVSRLGKNNVAIVCVPNPPMDTKSDSTEPVTFLIRVRTGEEADELKDVLLKYKSSGN